MDSCEELARLKEGVRRRTRLVLEKVTPEQLDWVPAPEALTIRQMLRHMRLSDEGNLEALEEGNWGYSARRPLSPLVDQLGEPESWEAELAAFERAHQGWVAFIRSLAPDGLSREFINPNTQRRLTALEQVLGRIEHEVHHRAQISTYLRMLGEQWPSPYGRLR